MLTEPAGTVAAAAAARAAPTVTARFALLTAWPRTPRLPRPSSANIFPTLCSTRSRAAAAPVVALVLREQLVAAMGSERRRLDAGLLAKVVLLTPAAQENAIPVRENDCEPENNKFYNVNTSPPM